MREKERKKRKEKKTPLALKLKQLYSYTTLQELLDPYDLQTVELQAVTCAEFLVKIPVENFKIMHTLI